MKQVKKHDRYKANAFFVIKHPITFQAINSDLHLKYLYADILVMVSLGTVVSIDIHIYNFAGPL